MVMEYLFGLMVQYIKASFQKIIYVEKVFTSNIFIFILHNFNILYIYIHIYILNLDGQMKGNIMVNGLITKCMDKEYSLGKMVDYIEENINLIR